MMKKDSFGHILYRAKVLRKTLITFLIGGLAYFITDLSGQNQTWALAASVFMGGVSLVVQFLADFDNRLESVEKKQVAHFGEIRSLVEDGFARTSMATELFQAVEVSPLQTDTVIQLIRNSTEIAHDSPPLIHGFAQWQINRTSSFLKALSDGTVSYDGEDQDWILGLTTQCQRSIDATSLSTVDAGGKSFEGGLWTSSLGRQYLKLQGEAMKNRGVTIRRVFIIVRPGQTSEADFLRISQQHQDLGIQVRVLDRSKISDPALFDFIIFDRVLSYEVTPTALVEDSTRPTIIKTQLELHPEKVMERIRRFEDLWADAQELKSPRYLRWRA